MENAPAVTLTLVFSGTGTCNGATLLMMGGAGSPTAVASVGRGGGMGGATTGGRGGVTPGLTGVPSYGGVVVPCPCPFRYPDSAVVWALFSVPSATGDRGYCCI
jgi:hypothetical protein